METIVNEKRNIIVATKAVDKRETWRKSMLGFDFWHYPLMKRLFGPKWINVLDMDSATGSPPNMNCDKLTINANTNIFGVKMVKPFYFTEIRYENGVMAVTSSGYYDPGVKDKENILYWDNFDKAFASEYNLEYIIIIDKIEEGD